MVVDVDMGDYGRETTFSHNIPNRNEQKECVYVCACKRKR